MTTKNLAVVFGPTLFRTEEDDPLTMLRDAGHVSSVTDSLIRLYPRLSRHEAGEAEAAPAPADEERRSSHMWC